MRPLSLPKGRLRLAMQHMSSGCDYRIANGGIRSFGRLQARRLSAAAVASLLSHFKIGTQIVGTPTEMRCTFEALPSLLPYTLRAHFLKNAFLEL